MESRIAAPNISQPFARVRLFPTLGLLTGRSVLRNDAIADTGITMSSNGTYRDNTVINFSTPYSGGVAGTGNL